MAFHLLLRSRFIRFAGFFGSLASLGLFSGAEVKEWEGITI